MSCTCLTLAPLCNVPCRGSNPVKLVFLDIVRKEINVLRALKRGGVVKGNVNRQVYAMQQYDPTFVGW